MMTNLECNIVLSYCKINVYFKFSVTNFDVVPGSDIGTWHTIYKAVCSNPVT
jgi:hypothetical protein